MKIFLLTIVLGSVMPSVFAQDTTYHAVTRQLFKIDELDQRYRSQYDYVEATYGKGSSEVKDLFGKMRAADSINLSQVKSIIQLYGWLGYDDIGEQANTALFMVIQHSDPVTQKNYLPLMREAARKGKARVRQLALLEDRVAVHEGKGQLYGSQLLWNLKTGHHVIWQISDPDNLDARRASVGLGPYADYLKEMGIPWNLEKYKKESAEGEQKRALNQ